MSFAQAHRADPKGRWQSGLKTLRQSTPKTKTSRLFWNGARLGSPLEKTYDWILLSPFPTASMQYRPSKEATGTLPVTVSADRVLISGYAVQVIEGVLNLG